MSGATATTLTATTLRSRLEAVPRVRLAHLPTPLQELPRLGDELGIRLFVKRDDLTGLALGGNKSRILEFRIAEILAGGATDVLAVLDVQSNSAAQTAAAANRFGLRTHLFLAGDAETELQGNLLLDSLLGAEIEFLPTLDAARRAADEAATKLRDEGRVPFLLNTGEMFELGSCLAYVGATLELVDQLGQVGCDADALYLSSAGKSQAGVVLAARLLGLSWRIVGIAARPAPEAAAVIADTAARAAERLGERLAIRSDEVTNSDAFSGSAYKRPTADGRAALDLAARLEGLLLDTTYTAKAMAGLIAHVRSGRVPQGSVVVFVHTGGLGGIFAEARALFGNAVCA
jgi:D-cysteine desulfhydrase/L-cysteate sulfo-lyase